MSGRTWHVMRILSITLFFIFTGAELFSGDAPSTAKKNDSEIAAVGIGGSSTATKEIADIFVKSKIPKPRLGILVCNIVPYGPGDESDILELDVINKINETPISDAKSYTNKVESLAIGKESIFSVYRLSDDKKRWKSNKITVIPISKKCLEKIKSEAPPLRIVSAKIHKNIIGVPEVKVRLENKIDSVAIAIKIDIECWNRFGEEVKGWSGKTNIYSGIAQKNIDAYRSGEYSWQLAGHETTSKVRIFITKIKFKDGSEWSRKEKTDGYDLTVEIEE